MVSIVHYDHTSARHPRVGKHRRAHVDATPALTHRRTHFVPGQLREISRAIAIPQSTLKRYLTLLETTYLITMLPAWSTNRGKRLIKTPKIFMTDTGLTTHLLGMNEQLLLHNPDALGKLMETFVLMELTKQATWSEPDVQMYYYRTADGNEVDIVLERRDGSIVGVEVKSSSSLDASANKGLKMLAETAGKKFRRGIILYTGNTTVPFGNNILALPMQSLWSST